MEIFWTNKITIDNERNYIIDTNNLHIPPSTDTKTETIQERLKDLERIKQKNITFYDKLYKIYPLQQYLEKKEHYKNMRFKIFKGYELKRFIQSKI